MVLVSHQSTLSCFLPRLISLDWCIGVIYREQLSSRARIEHNLFRRDLFSLEVRHLNPSWSSTRSGFLWEGVYPLEHFGPISSANAKVLSQNSDVSLLFLSHPGPSPCSHTEWRLSSSPLLNIDIDSHLIPAHFGPDERQFLPSIVLKTWSYYERRKIRGKCLRTQLSGSYPHEKIWSLSSSVLTQLL